MSVLAVVALACAACATEITAEKTLMHDVDGLKVALLQVLDVPTEKHIKNMSLVTGNTSLVTSENKAIPSASDMDSVITQLILHGNDLGAKTGANSTSEFAATPFGGTVKKIKDVIEKEMMPEVMDAHKADQKELEKLSKMIQACNNAKAVNFRGVTKEKVKYLRASKIHKPCRVDEAIKHGTQKACFKKEAMLKKVKEMRCSYYATIARKTGDSTQNRKIVSRSGSESAESYVKRLTSTFCGKPGGKGKGGAGADGFLDQFLKAKEACLISIKQYKDQVKKCKREYKTYTNAKARCNSVQLMMDGAACKRATLTKDACETYAECYKSKSSAYAIVHKTVKTEEKDRKAEWKGLKRMACIIHAFTDGKVKNAEIDACKKQTHSTNHLSIKYPKIAPFEVCQVPKDYPDTSTYKKVQYAMLPIVAKGKTPMECAGVVAISTTPKKGSPKTCKCTRVTLNGPYSAGPMVKCLNCHMVRRSVDKNSCPRGTKLFSPASRTDWATFIRSAGPLRAPNFIIDVTRPKNGCGGCTRHPMNIGNANQKTWRTSDGSPWWLRSTRYKEPNGDYRANCYLDLWRTPKDPNQITFNDGSCNYRSKSYYCERQKVNTKPAPGSPKSCKCERVELAGKYSTNLLVKCEQCLTVYKSSQKNSCPTGMKIFSPANKQDWKTFIKSAKPLRAPHWIIDVTRPANGCGGCTRYPMKSTQGQQATWRTSDLSSWWLRDTRYNEPNGDYHANCFLDLWRTPANENNVQFNDGSCSYRSKSYYCQPKKSKAAAKAAKVEKKAEEKPQKASRWVLGPSKPAHKTDCNSVCKAKGLTCSDKALLAHNKEMSTCKQIAKFLRGLGHKDACSGGCSGENSGNSPAWPGHSNIQGQPSAHLDGKKMCFYSGARRSATQHPPRCRGTAIHQNYGRNHRLCWCQSKA
jgi:hypothetical protein